MATSGKGSGSAATDTSIVSLSALKTHLRVDHSNEDTLITTLRDAVTGWAQNYTRRQFISVTKTLVLDYFPTIIRPLWSPLVSVTSITYTDAAGDPQTFDSDDYDVDTDSEPGRIVEAYAESWPVTRAEINAVTVTYIAGYGAASTDTPEAITAAVKMFVGHLYENRESVDISRRIGMLELVPMGVTALLGPYRVLHEFGHSV